MQTNTRSITRHALNRGVLAAVLMASAGAYGQTLVPKHIAAPPTDITSGVVRLPDPEFTGESSAIAVYRVDGNNWQRTIDLPTGANVRVLTLPAEAGTLRAELRKDRLAYTLDERTPGATRNGPNTLYRLGVLDGGAWELSGSGEGHVIVEDGSPFRLYVNVTSHDLVKGERVGISVRVLDQRTEDGLRLPVTGSAFASAMVEITDEAGTTKRFPMLDDGAGEDAAAGDGVATATVPLDSAGTFTARVITKSSINGANELGRTASVMLPVIERPFRFTGEARFIETPRGVAIWIPVSDDAATARIKVGAEIWAILANGDASPVCWVGGIVESERDVDGTHGIAILVDPSWAALVDGEIESLELRQLRLQDVRTGIPFDRTRRAQLVGDRLMLDRAGLREDANPARALHPGIDRAIQLPALSGASRAFAGHNLLLVHGYCTDANPWPTGDFTGFTEFFLDADANRSHDDFAQLIAAFGSDSKSFGIVAHSQGGAAALQLLTYYWSGLDWAQGPRLIQSVGTPYLGTPLAGDLAVLGDIFGAGCGVNFDLSVDGAALWLAGIPTESRQRVHYYTTSFEDRPFVFDFCQFVSDFFLADPDDGVIERARGQLSGANNRGHLEGWCHTEDMRDPPHTRDASRNSEMNANAAR